MGNTVVKSIFHEAGLVEWMWVGPGHPVDVYREFFELQFFAFLGVSDPVKHDGKVRFARDELDRIDPAQSR